MPSQDPLRAAVGQIKSYGAVAVLGAGLSAPRYPMTAELRSLLWHAIDSDDQARSSLAKRLGRQNSPAKALIGDDPDAVEAAWNVVEQHAKVRRAFQDAFARLDGDREPSPAHYAIAQLMRAGLVEYVVSFNWDTALERAYEQLFGTSLIGRQDLLAKPHGDAAAPEIPWIFPHKEGVVPGHVDERISQLSKQRPRVLLVIGYSGSDVAVVERLLEPAERRWPVVRIGPDAEGPEAVTGLADDVMPVLAAELNAPADMIGWRWVRFTRLRDLRAALLGYRLGPQDVHACPPLPAVQAVADRLRQTGFAVIVGDSGAGKSISAFQAAHRLHEARWAVVELSQPGVATTETVRVFESLPGPVVAVVDDAQALAPEVTWALERAVSVDHAVLLVATERSPGQELVRISAAQAVASLVEYCQVNAAAVERLVSEIDDRVRDGLAGEPYPRRLEAAKSSDYPWQFMFVLSGGERRINETLTNLADREGADLLFGILAATQLLSLDAGVTVDELVRHAETAGRDEAWTHQSLAALAEHRLVLNRMGRIRTPHMRIADRGLMVLCRHARNPSWPDLLAFMRSCLLDADQPLQGVLWMLRTVDQADMLRFGHPQLVLDDAVTSCLIGRCLATPAGRERNVAAYVLWELNRWHTLQLPMAERIAGVMPTWITAATSADIYGIQWLLGGIRSSFPDLHGAISIQLQPEEIARLIEDRGAPDSGESWGNLLNELAHAEGVDSKEWTRRFQAALDTERIAAWVRSADGSASLRGNIEFVGDLAWLAPRAAANLIEAMSPALSTRLESDPAGAARDLVPWAFGIFAFVAIHDEDREEPDDGYGDLRDAVLRWLGSTNWEAVGQTLTRAHLYEMDQLDALTFSLARIAPEALTRMGRSVSLDELDELTAGRWATFDQIERLVASLGLGADREPARSWILRHRDEIRRLPTRLVPVAPDVAVEVVRNGGEIELEVQDGLRWDWCTEALEALLAVDRDAARAVADRSRAAIAGGLVLRQANMTEHLDDFVRTLDAIDPAMAGEILNTVDPARARKHWAERLEGSEDEVAAVNLLIARALAVSGAIAEVAESLGGAGR